MPVGSRESDPHSFDHANTGKGVLLELLLSEERRIPKGDEGVWEFVHARDYDFGGAEVKWT